MWYPTSCKRNATCWACSPDLGIPSFYPWCGAPAPCWLHPRIPAHRWHWRAWPWRKGCDLSSDPSSTCGRVRLLLPLPDPMDARWVFGDLYLWQMVMVLKSSRDAVSLTWAVLVSCGNTNILPDMSKKRRWMERALSLNWAWSCLENCSRQNNG